MKEPEHISKQVSKSLKYPYRLRKALVLY